MPIFGVALLLFAIVLFSNMLTARVTVADNSGKENDIPISILDVKEAARFVSVVNQTLADQTLKEPPPSGETTPVDASPVDRISQLAKLTELRDSGALSDSEFQDEKKRILDSD